MYPQTLRLTLLATLVVVAQPAFAGDPEPGPPPSAGKVCWYAPKNTSANDRTRLTAALTEAMAATKPSHADVGLERVTSKARASSVDCIASIDVTKKKDYSRNKELLFSFTKAGEATPLLERAVVLDMRKAESAMLTELWNELWPLLAPAPPPPPPPPPVAETPFVDEELEAVQAQENAPKPEGPPRGPLVSVLADLGLFGRSLGDLAPGRPVDQSGVLSLGVSAVLHAAEIFRIAEKHDIDVDVAYAYHMLRAPEGSGVSVNADRFNVGGAYRFQLPGEHLPRVGALGGYELLRNELDQGAGAYSVRYGVLRLGLSLVQRVPLDEGLALRGFLEAALRITPSAELADTSPGFDIGGGVGLHMNRLLVRARVRYAQQSVEAGGSSFSDGFFDLDLGIGFQL